MASTVLPLLGPDVITKSGEGPDFAPGEAAYRSIIPRVGSNCAADAASAGFSLPLLPRSGVLSRGCPSSGVTLAFIPHAIFAGKLRGAFQQNDEVH